MYIFVSMCSCLTITIYIISHLGNKMIMFFHNYKWKHLRSANSNIGVSEKKQEILIKKSS